MLEEELIKIGCRYSDNEDGSYNVEYNGYAVTVSEDEEDWYLNYIKIFFLKQAILTIF